MRQGELVVTNRPLTGVPLFTACNLSDSQVCKAFKLSSILSSSFSLWRSRDRTALRYSLSAFVASLLRRMKGGSVFEVHALLTMSTNVPEVFAISGAIRCNGDGAGGDFGPVWADGD